MQAVLKPSMTASDKRKLYRSSVRVQVISPCGLRGMKRAKMVAKTLTNCRGETRNSRLHHNAFEQKFANLSTIREREVQNRNQNWTKYNLSNPNFGIRNENATNRRHRTSAVHQQPAASPFTVLSEAETGGSLGDDIRGDRPWFLLLVHASFSSRGIPIFPFPSSDQQPDSSPLSSPSICPFRRHNRSRRLGYTHRTAVLTPRLDVPRGPRWTAPRSRDGIIYGPLLGWYWAQIGALFPCDEILAVRSRTNGRKWVGHVTKPQRRHRPFRTAVEGGKAFDERSSLGFERGRRVESAGMSSPGE